LLLLGASIWSAHPAAQGPGPEYQLKAAFVSKFPEFAEWPESALNGRKTLELCVASPNPFGNALADLVAGEELRGRPLVTRDVADARAIDTCQLLFVPQLAPSARKEFLARAAALPILTVGDYPAFLDEGGIVNLLVVNGQVRFEISVAAANRARLRLSSQLLQLALSVRGEPL
jgi:hypothetical protein